MGAIDVGSAATDRGTSWSLASTVINYNNAANLDGIITQVQMFKTVGGGGTLYIALFQYLGSDKFTTRSYTTVTTTADAGLFTFTGLSLAVKTGDFIGAYHSADGISRSSDGTRYYNGGSAANFIPCTNQAFTSTDSRQISLYGTGVTLSKGLAVPKLIAVGEL
jgi:hypothetical protein